MIIDLSKFTPSDYAAWWGAAVASLAFLWNVVAAVRSGPRVKITVTPEMQIFPNQAPTYDKTYVTVRAINVGTGKTTITHCAGYYTTNILGVLLKKYRQFFMINIDSQTGHPVPFILDPGTEWTNLADQEFLMELTKSGRVYLGIIHNQRKRPIYKRVKLKCAASENT